MKIITIALAILLTTSIASAQEPETFLGAWNWESTTLGDGTVVTPEETGIYTQLQFLPDYSFIRFENLHIVEQGEWFLSSFWVENTCVTTLGTTEGDLWYSLGGLYFSQLHMSSGSWESPATEHFTFIAPTPTDSPNLGSIKSWYR